MQTFRPFHALDRSSPLPAWARRSQRAGSEGWNLRRHGSYRRASALAFLAFILVVPTGLVTSLPSVWTPVAHAAGAAGSAIEDAARSLAHGGGPARGAPIACAVLPLQAVCGDSPSRASYGAVGNASFNWVNLTSSTNNTPECRSSMGMTYDAADGYVLLFDGLSGCLPNVSSAHNDTWEFSNDTWTNVTATLTSSPSARFMMGMVYDASDDSVVMFGGMQIDGTMLSDTWTWSRGAWTEQLPTTSPSARLQPAMAYDPVSGTVMLFGGSPYSGAPAYFGDTWSYSAGSWTQISPTGGVSPSSRRDSAMAFDPGSQSLLLFGGVDPNGFGFGDTWSYSNGTWSPLSPSGAAPPARWDAGLVTFPGLGGVVMFGGCTALGCDSGLSDTWFFQNGSWYDLTPSLNVSPSQRGAIALSYDSADGYAMLFGGAQNGGRLADTWVLLNGTLGNLSGGGGGGSSGGGSSGGSPAGPPVTPSTTGWTNLTPGLNLSPPCRSSMGMTYDGADGYVILLDGLSGCVDPSSSRTDTWTFVNGTWTNLTANLTVVPTPRSQFQLAYDSAGPYVVLFGGADQYDNPFGDTWTWSAGAWSQLNTTTAPPARFQYSETFDGADGAVLLFGGVAAAGSGTYFNDTWAFTGGIWINASGSVAPSPRRAAGLAYDAADGYVVLFGGVDPNAVALNDTWSYVGGVWTDLSGSLSGAPPARWDPGFAYDPQVAGLVLFGGCTSLGCYSMQGDTWIWRAGAWTDVTSLLSVSPSPRGAISMTYDDHDGYDIFFAGAANGGRLADTWVFTTVNVSGTTSGSGGGSGGGSGSGSGGGSGGTGAGNGSGNHSGNGSGGQTGVPPHPGTGSPSPASSMGPAVAWMPDWWWAGGRLGFALGLLVGVALASSAAYLRHGRRDRSPVAK